MNRQSPVASRPMPQPKSTHRFVDLTAWQKAMDLVEDVYRVTRSFPKEELYGLTSQLRKSAIPVPSNIAEGSGRKGHREFAHHLSIALGSLAELETQVLIAQRLGYFAEESDVVAIRDLTAESGRITVGLLNSMERHTKAS